MQHVSCKVVLCVRFTGACDVPYNRCRNRARVDAGLSVGVNVTVGVSSNGDRIVVVLTKNVL